MHSGEIIRQVNEARALEALFGSGGLSRAELARLLELTRSTTGNLVQSLEEAGLVRERSAGRARSDAPARMGRPGTTIEIEPDGAFFVGAYIGVDRLVALGIDLAAQVRTELTEPFDGRKRSPEVAVQRVASLIDRVTGSLPDERPPRGVSVAVPGFLGQDGTTCHAAILGWHDVNIARLLEDRLGGDVPLLVENDANAYAVAERYAAGVSPPRDTDDALVVLIEDGVGAGILAGGRLLRGRGHGMGEIGHMPVGDRGFVIDRARPGRFESYVGKEALLARHRFHGGRQSDLGAFLSAFDAGRVAARRAADDWTEWLCRGLSTLASALELQRIVVGGSVGTPMFSRVRAEVHEAMTRTLAVGYPMPELVVSGVGDNGPALGAACLLHRRELGSGAELRDVMTPGGDRAAI